MSNTNTAILSFAHELGYFPSRTQLARIKRLSIQHYAQLQSSGHAPISGNVPLELIRSCNQWAITQVMGDSKRLKAIITGRAGDESLSYKIRIALERAAGKWLRVRIEEIDSDPETGGVISQRGLPAAAVCPPSAAAEDPNLQA